MIDSASALAQEWQQYLSERVRQRKWVIEAYVRYVHRLALQNLPPVFEFTHLADVVGIDRGLLARIITNPENFYRKFEIPKRSGGVRTLMAPSPSLLHVQRWIKSKILDSISVHNAAFAYVGSRSAIDNARCHLGSHAILKMDLKDFFPSISINRGLAVFNAAGYPRKISYYLATCCFVNGHLPQGAATSPTLSNIIAKRLDRRLQGLSAAAGLRYTRYADDLTFSGDKIARSFVSAVSSIVTSEGFQVNREKTLLRCGQKKKIVTGISVGGGNLRIPRSTSRRIKLHAHLLLKNGLHRFTLDNGEYDPLIIERLLGQVAYWLQVEPHNKTAMYYMNALINYRAEVDRDGP